MRFTLSSSALSSQLNILSRVINSKNSIPILDCFLFQVKGNTLVVTSSDNENTMTGEVMLDESDGDGEFAVPSRTILDAVKELPEQPLTFEVNTDSYAIKVVYQNGLYNFTAQNAEEYPRVQPINDGATTLAISERDLSDNIGRTLFATAQEELRPVMNGIYFDLTPDALAIVATDGHKLVRNKLFTIKNDVPASFILPKKPANLLKNVLSKDDDEVNIRFDDQNVEIDFNGGHLSCRLIEGRYPNYDSVIPRDNPNTITIDRRALLGALRRVLPFASESSQLVRLKVESGKLELTSEDIDFATSARELITCEYVGSPMSIGFKGGSLMEILSNLTSDDVIIRLADPSRAGVIVPAVQPENEDVLMLIMPMLLND